MADPIDYRRLLVEYIALIKWREGFDFLDLFDRDKGLSDLTPVEMDALFAASADANALDEKFRKLQK